jgi:hypothetical protein
MKYQIVIRFRAARPGRNRASSARFDTSAE